jgi:hypothetical protein
MLLEEPPLRDALLRQLTSMTETDLGSVASFHAEVVHDDRARPGLQGQDSGGNPLVSIEAKRDRAGAGGATPDLMERGRRRSGWRLVHGLRLAASGRRGP